jgi:hypothetical protein
VDEIRRAYALLGVKQGSTLAELHARYRALVKQWHPDLHSTDPQGQAEAAVQMRQINAAYRQVLGTLAFKRTRPSQTAPAHSSTPNGRRLSRAEIDRMVAAVGTSSLVDDILGEYTGEYELSPYFAAQGAGRILAVVVVVVVAILLWSTDLSIRSTIGIGVAVGCCGAGAFVWYRVSRGRQTT